MVQLMIDDEVIGLKGMVKETNMRADATCKIQKRKVDTRRSKGDSSLKDGTEVQVRTIKSQISRPK
jgi:hypothetical protein